MVMVQQTSGKRETAKLERRERLYEAALELFRAQGYEATTVDQITRQAGLAKGTFFNYFPRRMRCCVTWGRVKLAAWAL